MIDLYMPFRCYRLVIICLLLILSAGYLPAQNEVPEKEQDLGLTPNARGADLSWVDSIQAESLLFFEKGREELPVDQRSYQTEFDQATTRYVAWELRLQHPPPAKIHPFTIETVFYGPAGNELGRLQHETQCAPGEQKSIHSRGWGWPDPGFWTEGAYRVAFYIGDRLLDEKTFHIVRSSAAVTRDEWIRDLSFDFLRFYEKGKETIPYEKRVYRSWFDQQSTRYVAWELHLRHPPAAQPVDLNLQAIYYFPDGRVFGRDEIKTWVEPNWPTSWHTSGWGWPKAGFWQKGIYRVEFYLEGQRLATDYFEIR